MDKKRTEQNVEIKIENEVLRRDGVHDVITVDAAVIWKSPGRIIFIAGPTMTQFSQRHFSLNGELKIHHRGNIFLVEKLAFSKAPIHPIFYTTFLSPNPSYRSPVTGFDWEMERHWKNPAWTPEEY